MASARRGIRVTDCVKRGIRLPDFTDQQFGRLSALCRAPTPLGKRGAYYDCLCSCGEIVTVLGSSLNAGDTKSCGCYMRERVSETMTKHGATYTPTWNAWRGMIARCTQPKMQSYRYYGGRGICVCARWMNFPSFLTDMGEKPYGMTLDRIDSSKHYEPSNCRWATPGQQAVNKSNNIWVEIGGRRQVLSHWAKEIGINRTTVLMRIHRGWDTVRALTEPTKL